MRISTIRDAILKIRGAKTEVEMALAVSEFQGMVWESETIAGDEGAVDVVRDLAYDLDYFEPDEKRRTEDVRFFGPDRLVLEVEKVLQKLEVACGREPEETGGRDG